MAGDRRFEEWDGVVIRLFEHRRQYAADKVFKDETTAQWETSVLSKLQPVKDWLLEDQKASEKTAAKDTGIAALTAAINEYNASIEGEFGDDSEAFRTRPHPATRVDGWDGVVIRAIEHRRQYAAGKVFQEQTTEAWEAELLGHLQKVKDWIEADQKAKEKAGARDTGVTALRDAINEYNASIEGEFGQKSEAYKKRVRVNRSTSSKGSTTDPTKVDPSK